jgi:translation initiation factor IF-3
MNYGKFKFDTAQRAKESRRKASSSSIKEMKYRPKIGVGDFDTKTRQVSKFLGEGHKVKITIMFRGRELSHQELGLKILNRVADTVHEIAKVEAAPKVDGRNMIMVLAPDRRAQQAAAKAKQPAEGESVEAADPVEAAEPVEAPPNGAAAAPTSESAEQPAEPAGNGSQPAANGAAAPVEETTTQET